MVFNSSITKLSCKNEMACKQNKMKRGGLSYISMEMLEVLYYLYFIYQDILEVFYTIF